MALSATFCSASADEEACADSSVAARRDRMREVVSEAGEVEDCQADDGEADEEDGEVG